MTQNQESGDEVLIRKMHKGDFFGEKALTAPTSPTASSPSTPSTSKISDNSSGALRTANVIAEDSPDDTGVSCLVIDRDAFHQLISNRIHNFVPPSDTEAGYADHLSLLSLPFLFTGTSVSPVTSLVSLSLPLFSTPYRFLFPCFSCTFSLQLERQILSRPMYYLLFLHLLLTTSLLHRRQNDEQGSFFDRVSIDDITKVVSFTLETSIDTEYS